MAPIRGIFLSDVHLPFNIPLNGVFTFVKDYRPHQIILGGDIIDADGTFGVDGWGADAVERDLFRLYERDLALLRTFIRRLRKGAPRASIIFLEGNHEERYQRPKWKYPKLMAGRCDLAKDLGKLIDRWIPYGDYDSFYRVGDMLFTHGTIYPDAHAKKMALAYAPAKIVYGHQHDFQGYTTHTGDPRKPSRYAFTGGCLCGRLPEYKGGTPNRWTNGFATWASVAGVTSAAPVPIEKWGFLANGKVYR